MKRTPAIALPLALALMLAGPPAYGGRERDARGDTYRLDIEQVKVRREIRGGKPVWVVRLDTYDDFTNDMLERNPENSMYAVAVRFETRGGRPCDRNLQVEAQQDEDGDWTVGAWITGPRDYRKWDGGSPVRGTVRWTRPEADNIAFFIPERLLSKKPLERLGWGLRTVSHENNGQTIYFDYSPEGGKLAWARG